MASMRNAIMMMKNAKIENNIVTIARKFRRNIIDHDTCILKDLWILLFIILIRIERSIAGEEKRKRDDQTKIIYFKFIDFEIIIWGSNHFHQTKNLSNNKWTKCQLVNSLCWKIVNRYYVYLDISFS